MTNKNYVIDFFAFVISISAFILGFYSFKYNQDFHHWGLQLSYLIDYKNGFSFFKEIYLQYGQGQTLFLYIVDKVFDINFFTIGIVVQLIYSINLFFIYKVFCTFLRKQYALLILLLIYLIHPYIIYPWPDYSSGLCLTLAAYFLLIKKNYSNFNYIFSGFLLFLSIFFRTSYLITIIPGFIFFFLFFKKNFIKEKINILALSFFSFLFLYFVFLNKNLSYWYYQGLGSITSYAYGSNHYLMSTVIDNYGENVWIFLKLSKMFLRFLYKLFNIFSLNNFIFTFFLVVSLFYLFFLYFKKKIKEITSLEIKLIFVLFIGFFGFLQSFMIYETFRNINSTLGIIFFGMYILKKINFSKKNLLVIRMLIFLIIINLLQKFPNVSNYSQLFFKNNGDFVESSVNYFPKNSLLLIENNNYYKKLNQVVCSWDKKIINLSYDFVIPYLCNSNKKKFSAMMVGFFAKTNPREYKRIFENNILLDDEMLITSKDINSTNIIKIFEFDLPSNLIWFSMYDNYSKKIFGYIKS
jgi:hypothetical protein